MAPTVPEGAKRGRGRPPKAESEKVAAKVGKSGRPRGRPPGSTSKEKKPVTLSGGIKKKTVTPTAAGAKRGPGRPPKSAVDASPKKSAASKKAVAPTTKTAAAKRKVAAPKMLPAVPVAEPAAPKRKPPTPRTLTVPGEKKRHGKPGRPRKSDVAATLPKRAPGRPRKSTTPGSATPKARGTPAAAKGGSPVLGDEPGVEAVDEDDRDAEGEPKSEDQDNASPQQNGGKSENEDEDESAAQ